MIDNIVFISNAFINSAVPSTSGSASMTLGNQAQQLQTSKQFHNFHQIKIGESFFKFLYYYFLLFSNFLQYLARQ